MFSFCPFFLGYIFHFRGISCSQGNPVPQAFNDSTGSYMPNALGFTAILPLKSSLSCDNQLSLQLSSHRTGKVPHHSRGSCDLETTWPANTSFDSKPGELKISNHTNE